METETNKGITEKNMLAKSGYESGYWRRSLCSGSNRIAGFDSPCPDQGGFVGGLRIIPGFQTGKGGGERQPTTIII